jgi:hypothetical protein
MDRTRAGWSAKSLLPHPLRSAQPLDDEGRTVLKTLPQTAAPSRMRAPKESSGVNLEVSHANQDRSPRRRVLSRSQVNDAKASRPRRASSAAFVSCATGKSFSRSLVATTLARAHPAADFKNCCMLTGEFDGSDRHHFFQGVKTSSNNAHGASCQEST